jgi:hypothetical protein
MILKRQQTTTTVTDIEEGELLDGLRSMVARWATNYPIPFL